MDDKTMFVIFYSGLVSIQHHPRNSAGDINYDYLIEVALSCVQATNKIYPQHGGYVREDTDHAVY